MISDYIIREASSEDVEKIVRFTVQEAEESQGAIVDVFAVHRGVSAAFSIPSHSKYWVIENADGVLIASTSIITEWSDFHGANYWWIQSFYIIPEYRGKQLPEFIVEHIRNEAILAGALELRLYVHASNNRAINAYKRCGFETSPYTMMKISLDHLKTT